MNRGLNNYEIIESMNSCNTVEDDLIFSFNFDSIVDNKYLDIYNIHYGEIIDITSSNENPICCDCEISSSEISACKGSTVDITTNSILEPLWDDGSNSIVYSPLIFSDTTISVIFLDSGNVI